MKLLIFLLFLISPLLLVTAVLISPIYFTYKIISRVYDFKEAKNGYKQAPQNPLMNFAMPFLKDMITKK